MIRNQKRFKIVLSFILVMLTTMTLGLLGYTFYERGQKKELVQKLVLLQTEVEQCRIEAEQQIEISKKIEAMAMQKAEYVNLTNLDFIEQRYQEWAQNPENVDESWRFFFEGFELARSGHAFAGAPESAGVWQIERLIQAYRSHGHFQAKINPLEKQAPPAHADLSLSRFGLSDVDPTAEFPSADLPGPEKQTLQQILDRLETTYCGNVGIE